MKALANTLSAIRSSRSELRFRVALSGARHLGSDPHDRETIFRTLRTAYDQASQAVHGNTFAEDAANRKLLTDAQDICRRAIIQSLREGEFQLEQAMFRE